MAGILAFTWIELAFTSKEDPSVLAILALAYAVAQLVGMSVYGADAWARRGDAFSVYFNLFARLAPLQWRQRRLQLQPPLVGVTRTSTVPGTVALVCVMIGSTSFDGLSLGPIWQGSGSSRGLVDLLQDFFSGTLGMSLGNALQASFTIGLLLMIGLITALYLLGVQGMSRYSKDRTSLEIARDFAHTLVPIALAYVVAHYVSLLAYQSQAIAYLASDPLGKGSDLFGTADAAINYSVITSTQVWYVQVAALVIGHVSALVLAHDRALVEFPEPTGPTRSQYWMLSVMVAFTCLGLFLLSAGD